MIRNLRVIAAINVFLLMVNLYLLKSSSNQLNNGEEMLQGEIKFDNILDNVNDLNPNSQRIREGKSELPTTKKYFSRDKNVAIDLNKTNGHWRDDLEFTKIKEQPVINGSGFDIYQRTFYDQTSPHKERKNRDWSFLRQVYRIPLLPRVDKINCEALLDGNNEEILLAKDYCEQTRIHQSSRAGRNVFTMDSKLCQLQIKSWLHHCPIDNGKSSSFLLHFLYPCLQMWNKWKDC